MKGFIFLGLLAGPLYFAQNVQDSLKTKEIESINFLKRLELLPMACLLLEPV